MRIIAGVLFHLLNWLRGPMLIVLMLMQGFFFLSLVAVLIAFVASPPAQHHTALIGLGIAFVGSFASYLARRGYDATLHRLSMARYA